MDDRTVLFKKLITHPISRQKLLGSIFYSISL